MKRDDQNYREFTLDNGLFVALQNTPTQTVSGRLRVFQGALHEQPGEEGLAHFLEHTIVNAGSRKYSPITNNLPRRYVIRRCGNIS